MYFWKCLISDGKNEKWYHESGKHVIFPLKFIVIELDILWSTLKSIVIENILNCGVLKFSSDFRVFGGIS